MGLLTRTLRGAFEGKSGLSASVPTWQSGQPQNPDVSYEALAKEGYSRNEIVFACIEELASSAAEPRFAAMRGDEKLDRHPVLSLVNRPNPFMSRFEMTATIIMHLMIAGNAYIEKVRSRSGDVVELWPMFPHMTRVVPDATKFIREYRYQVGAQTFALPPEDVIHFKTRHPLNQYYGMSPLAIVAGRVDTDNYMRQFTQAFFQNAGVPAGMLNFKKAIVGGPEEKDKIRRQFRQTYGGRDGWHSLFIADGGDVDYTVMGLPLGQRGLILPELDEISESRISMAFGVPLILIGSRLGMIRSTYANYHEARGSFWDETLAPLYAMLGSKWTLSLVPEFGGSVDELLYDLSDVKALQEDEDKVHERARANVAGGLWSHQEGREVTGLEADAPTGHIFFIPSNVVPTLAEEIIPPDEPEPVPPTEEVPPIPAPGEPPAPNDPVPPPPPGEPVPVPANGNGGA